MRQLEQMGLGEVIRIGPDNPGKFFPPEINQKYRTEMWFAKFGKQAQTTNALLVFKKTPPLKSSLPALQELGDKPRDAGKGR